jgi:eukaryotic translation initiation factor 2C
MEFCRTEIVGVKKLEPKQTSDMIKETAVPAYKRKNDIEKMIRETKLDSDPILKSYNIKLEYKMAEVMGKVINAPDLEYGQKRITSSGEIGLKGSWDNMVNIGFFINLKLYKLYDLLEQTFC